MELCHSDGQNILPLFTPQYQSTAALLPSYIEITVGFNIFRPERHFVYYSSGSQTISCRGLHLLACRPPYEKIRFDTPV